MILYSIILKSNFAYYLVSEKQPEEMVPYILKLYPDTLQVEARFPADAREECLIFASPVRIFERWQTGPYHQHLTKRFTVIKND